MTPNPQLFQSKSLGKAKSTADQRKNARKSATTQNPHVLRDGNADSTVFQQKEKKSL